jgi:iron complex outermembrane receptor protein
MRFWIALIGSSTLAMASASQAQEANQPDSSAGSIDEIVVTANKREEKIQDVPVTVNVVGAQQLDQQNITSIADLGRAVPALGGAFLGGTPSIRGVATGGFARSSEEAVSTVLDGVVLGRTATTQLFDIERVEVLSGPQGMLFGKNASAGVINIATVAPKLDTFEVIGSGDYGSLDYTRARLTVNVPLGSSAALRISGFEAGEDTPVRNTITGKRNHSETWGGRARLRFEPNDNLKINLIADYERTHGNGNFPYVVAILPTEDPFGTVTLDSQLAACGITASLNNTLNCGEGPSSKIARSRRYGFSGQIDLGLGDYLLTSITAKRWLDTGEFGYYGLGGDTDMVPADILSRNLTPSRYNVFSQELRLTSPANQPVDFVVGLYYSQSKNHDEIFQAGGLGYLPSGAADARYQTIDIDQKSYAAFGQATIHATDKLALIVGARFTHEKLSDVGPLASASQLSAILASQGLIYFPVGFGAGFAAVNEKISEDNFSWRLGAKYDFSQNFMAFLTASRGYKGPAVSDQGGRRDATGNALNPVIQEEIPLNFELGAKATILDGKVFAGLTLFQTKIDNFQTQVFAPAIGAIPAGFIQGNAPYVKTKGVDLSLFGRPFEGFTLNAGVIYTDAQYAPSFLVACAPQQITGVGGCSATRSTQAVDQIARTPKWRILLNGEYATEVASGITAFVQADMQHQSKIYLSPTPDPILRLPATTFINGRIGLRDIDGGWGVSVWGRNLFGERYNVMQPDFLALAGNGRMGVTPGSQPAYLTLPTRDWQTTYGVSVEFKF